MNNHAINGMAASNTSGTPMMNNGINGSAPKIEDREGAYKLRLNTYIYDYYLKNEQWDLARSLLNSPGLPVETVKASPGPRVNGVNDSVEKDIKEDVDSKRPADLPSPKHTDAFEKSSFLLEWFSLFWEIFWATKFNKDRTGHQALQYMRHTQAQSRERQLQQNNYLRQPGFPPGQMQYPGQIRMVPGGIPINARGPRGVMPNNMTPQQTIARNQHMQLMQQQAEERNGAEMDINGTRPRSPSASENAPSPSKRARTEGTPFNSQQIGQNTRMTPQSLQGQELLNYNMQAQEANNLLVQNNINPHALSSIQLKAFHNADSSTRKKSMQIYSQNMVNQHTYNMPRIGMPGSGVVMMPANMDLQAGMSPFQPWDSNADHQGSTSGGNVDLHDYQQQLMVLEQQNQIRLQMSRRQMGGEPGTFDDRLTQGQNAKLHYGAGMSPQGSRSGPSPNPSEQMKKGTPKTTHMGLPGSPMPDATLGQRGSPAPMNFPNGMTQEIFNAMKTMGDGMRPPSSHPQFSGMNVQQMEAARAPQNSARMANGAVWSQGPQGQASMMPQGQVQPQLGTPQPRSAAMPPPQGVPVVGGTNGRPASPAVSAAAPPTPQQANKVNPKVKKEGEKKAKRPTKKGSIVATTSGDGENPPPTPTPSTPITPRHPNSFNEKTGNSATQAPSTQTSVPATAATVPAGPPQTDFGMMGAFGNMDPGDADLSMTFSNLDTTEIMEQFDFDSFIQDSGQEEFALDTGGLQFDNYGTVEAGNGES